MTTTPNTTAPAPYVPAHGGMCPLGPHLVCADFNAMSQGMWGAGRQDWPCEGCGAPMTRTFAAATGWSAWRPANR